MKTRNLYEIFVPCIYEDTRTPVKTRHHRQWDIYVCGIAGGLTIYKPAVGYWVEKANNIVIDRNIPVRICCTENQIKLIAEFTKKHYRQKAIMYYLISEKVYFV